MNLPSSSYPLLQCSKISKQLGYKQLFENLSLSLYQGDKLGIIGPNGAGKSTLIKILSQQMPADSGKVTQEKSLRLHFVKQEALFSSPTPYQVLENQIPDSTSVEKHRLEHALSKVGFRDFHLPITKLSGGWLKKLQLAEAIVQDPDFLILDEPSNHLDLDSLLWLEAFLKREVKGYLVISHDRYFLQRTCDNILEINPLFPQEHFFAPCSYNEYVEKKAEYLQTLEKQEASVASRARKELKFLQSNPKARTTKSQARVQQAHRWLATLKTCQERKKRPSFQLSLQALAKRAKTLIQLKAVKKSYQDRLLIDVEDFKIVEGMRLGVIGPNGCGKSTFIKCLMELETWDQGTMKKYDQLKISYLSQSRQEIPQEQSLWEALASHGDFALYQGKKIHVYQLAENLGFEEAKLQQKVADLSGGEKAKLYLAKCFEHPGELLILDEPTNDLDIPTLESLEGMLSAFEGAVICVTHDRYFLQQIAGEYLTFYKGKVYSFASYEKYERWYVAQRKEAKPAKEKKKKLPQALNSQERKELKALPQEIEKMEAQLSFLNQELENHSLLGDYKKSQALAKEAQACEEKLTSLYPRWQELEDKKNRQDS